MDPVYLDIKDTPTRRFGGTQKVADPYVTGYHNIWFTRFPAALSESFKNTGIDNAPTESDMQQITTALCLSVTPPGATLNRIDLPGLGGLKWAVPGGVDYGNAISIKFLEMQHRPICHIMHAWVSMIRDMSYGASNEGITAPYNKKQYGGTLLYWTTLPDLETLDFFALYDGVWPTKDPMDLYASDIETIGRLDVEIEFHVDYIITDASAKQQCTSKIQNLKGFATKRGNMTPTPGG